LVLPDFIVIIVVGVGVISCHPRAAVVAATIDTVGTMGGYYYRESVARVDHSNERAEKEDCL
jgi:hypothetical protein